jgi:hypothetical protein
MQPNPVQVQAFEALAMMFHKSVLDELNFRTKSRLAPSTCLRDAHISNIKLAFDISSPDPHFERVLADLIKIKTIPELIQAKAGRAIYACRYALSHIRSKANESVKVNWARESQQQFRVRNAGKAFWGQLQRR